MSVPVARSQLTRVLVVGGSYAGLSVALNLLDLSNGLAPRFSGSKDPADISQQTPVEVTIVDERDGFCMVPTHLSWKSLS
jgi:hypothetical protein